MTQTTEKNEKFTGAEALLSAMKFHGVEFLFANAGTDFPPIIEALVKFNSDDVPKAVTVPHETASVGMAHGYYLVTGKTQAVMVHVNVGLANAVMGVINAASDNIPVLMMSGRTPITETGRSGGRMTPIQYGQEMYDQSSLVADIVKYHYEMRYPEQAEPLVSRALAAANSAPSGPVYLSLPREPLTEEFPRERVPPPSMRPPASPAHPDPDTLATAARWLEEAKSPLILVQRGDTDGQLSRFLQEFTMKYAIAVAEPF
jgi:acetolactate synthase-1/2/3 large subunit